MNDPEFLRQPMDLGDRLEQFKANPGNLAAGDLITIAMEVVVLD
jgi:hypothetical protein